MSEERMTEERLIEITSEILKNDGPLGKVVPISKLTESEAKELKEYIENPIYDGLNVYQKILKFSQDYLEGKNISLMNVVQNEQIEKKQDQQTMISYLEKMLSMDEDMHISGRKGRR